MSLLLPLMRRDPIWRYMPFAAVAGFGALAINLKAPGMQGAVAGMIGSIYVAFLGQARIQERASSFEAALPIDGRDLLKARLASLMLFLWFPVLVALVVTAQFGADKVANFAWAVAGPAVSASAAVVFLLLYRRPRVSAGRGVAVGVWLALVFWLVFQLAINVTGAVIDPKVGSLAIVAGGLLAIAVFVRRFWPQEALALQVSPLELQSAAGQVDTATAEPGAWAVLLPSLLNTQTTIWFGFAAFYPLLNNFVMPLCFVPGYLTGAYMSLRWMFPLPISRRRILAIIVLPFLACYGASIMINLTWGIGAQGDQSLDPRANGLRIASPWWKHVAANEKPVVQAPWGETHTPEVKRVWLVRSYNPWESGPENSREFRDWQFRRATLAVFGHELSWAERDRLSALRPLNRRPVENLLTLAALLFTSMLLMSCILIPRWSRISHLPQPVRKYGVLVLIVPLVLCLAVSPIFAEPLGNNGIFDLFTMAWADTVRANPFAAWSTILLVLWLLYSILGKQFSELEPDNQAAPVKGRSPFGGGLFS